MNETTRKMVTAFVKSAIADETEKAAALAALAPRKEEKPDKWLKTKEAVEIARVTSKTLHRAELAGKLHPRRLSPRLIRWSRNELELWLTGAAAASAGA